MHLSFPKGLRRPTFFIDSVPLNVLQSKTHIWHSQKTIKSRYNTSKKNVREPRFLKNIFIFFCFVFFVPNRTFVKQFFSSFFASETPFCAAGFYVRSDSQIREKKTNFKLNSHRRPFDLKFRLKINF